MTQNKLSNYDFKYDLIMLIMTSSMTHINYDFKYD